MLTASVPAASSAAYRRDYATTWAATLLFFMAFYTLLVPLPLYLAEIGLPPWQIGLIMSAFGVASLIGRPLAGIATDRLGHRWVMLVGATALTVGAIGTSLTTQPALLFVLRVLQAGGYVAFTTASTALVSDLAPQAVRGRALARFGVAANVAMTLTPAAINAGLALLTISGALWLTGALACASALLVCAVRSETPAPGSAQFGWQIPRSLYVPMVAAGLMGIGFGAFLQFLPLLSVQRENVPIGAIYPVYGVGIIATRLVTGRWLDRTDPGRVLQVAFALLAGGLALFAVGNGWLLLVASLLVAAGGGILHPLLIALHVAGMPEHARGRAVANFYLGFDLGIGGGAWLLGLALQWGGISALFGLAALVTAAGVVVARDPVARDPVTG